MRRHKLDRGDIILIVDSENQRGEDPKGNPMYVMQLRGTIYCAIVALDDRSLITVYDLQR